MQTNLFIDGQWQTAANDVRLPVIDPATEGVFAQVAAASAEDVEKAVASARRAFAAWRKTTGAERAVYLRGFAQKIRDRAEQMAEMETRDNGKPLPEAQWDIGDAACCFEYYAGLAEQLDEQQNSLISVPDARFTARVRYEPVGVAALIIPWNYPLLMAAWKVAPALAAGCTMVLKPSELTPLTALTLGEIALEIGLPRGVLNILNGTGIDCGQPLAAHPDVDKIAFTGSGKTGRAILRSAAQSIRKASLELGGKSPFIVFADSAIEAAVEWIMFGIFWNQGQVCSATSRVLIERSLYPALCERLIEASRQIKIGNGLEEGVKLGPLVSSGQYEKVQAFIAEAQHEGARMLSGGRRPAQLERGYFLEPTIFDQVPETSTLWREEVFGPVVALRPFDTEAEAVALANDTRYGLAAAVMSADKARCERVAQELEAGIIWINCSQPTFIEAPWGGVKESGIGRELGVWGLQNYLEPKQITAYHSAEKWGWYLP